MATVTSMFLLTFLFIAQGHAAPSIYEGLYDYIISKSDGCEVPPIQEVGKPVEVAMQVGILAVYDVDRDRNLVEVDLIASGTWNSSITWNPADYNSNFIMTLDRHAMWYPRLSIRNAVRVDKSTTDRIVAMANGFTGQCVRLKATVMCDLSSGDKCAVELISASNYNNVVTFKKPNSDQIKMKDHIGYFIHKASPFPVTESKNVKSTLKYEGFPNEMDIITLEFSFKDTLRHHRHHGFR